MSEESTPPPSSPTPPSEPSPALPPPVPPTAVPPPSEAPGGLTTSLRRPLAPRWRRPLQIAGLSTVSLLLGLWVGRSIFRTPEAPSFEPEVERSSGTPVEAAQATIVEVDATPPLLPTGPNASVDATDYGLLAQIEGDWLLNFGQRGIVQVTFTKEKGTRLSQAGYEVQIYRCESPQLPSRFSLVRVPDGGNFIAFHDDKGETRDVFENIELHNKDLFSFTEAATGRRRYASRAGTAGAPPVVDARPPLWPSGQLGRQDEESDSPPNAPFGDIAPSPEESADEDLSHAEEEAIDNLWQIAKRQRSARQYGPLIRTLDSLLEIDPHHRTAQRWRSEAQQQLREQNREALKATRSLLDDFAEAIEDRDLGDLHELWDDHLDGDTSRFFTQLFRRYQRVKVRAELLSISVDSDKRATGFEARITFEGKEKGRRAEVETYNWHGRLIDEHFASSFP